MDKKFRDKFSKCFANDPQSQGVKDAIASVGLMNNFTYQVMVERKYVDKKWLKAGDGEGTERKVWNPIGSLVKNY